MFDVPLVELGRERLLELLDVRFDEGCIRVLLWRIHFALVAERRQAPEVVIIFCELKCLVGESVTPYLKVSEIYTTGTYKSTY